MNIGKNKTIFENTAKHLFTDKEVTVKKKLQCPKAADFEKKIQEKSLAIFNEIEEKDLTEILQSEFSLRFSKFFSHGIGKKVFLLFYTKKALFIGSEVLHSAVSFEVDYKRKNLLKILPLFQNDSDFLKKNLMEKMETSSKVQEYIENIPDSTLLELDSTGDAVETLKKDLYLILMEEALKEKKVDLPINYQKSSHVSFKHFRNDFLSILLQEGLKKEIEEKLSLIMNTADLTQEEKTKYSSSVLSYLNSPTFIPDYLEDLTNRPLVKPDIEQKDYLFLEKSILYYCINKIIHEINHQLEPIQNQLDEKNQQIHSKKNLIQHLEKTKSEQISTILEKLKTLPKTFSFFYPLIKQKIDAFIAKQNFSEDEVLKIISEVCKMKSPLLEETTKIFFEDMLKESSPLFASICKLKKEQKELQELEIQRKIILTQFEFKKDKRKCFYEALSKCE